MCVVIYRVIYFLLFKCFHVIIVMEHQVPLSVHVTVVAAAVVAAASVAAVSVFLLFCLRKLSFSHFHTCRIFIVF